MHGSTWDETDTPPQHDALMALAQQVADIFESEPTDAADYKDAAAKIHSVWENARKIVYGE